MHRNTFVNSPNVLRPTLQLRKRDDLLLAGQITGVEGYLGNIGTGLLAGLNAVRLAEGATLLTLPPETMLGALCRYVTEAEPAAFQPMKANFGILPALEGPNLRNRSARVRAHLARGAAALRRITEGEKADLRIAIQA
jgi:methylenetetrahydrofolate--tRNA-(uracil-5-)-methyltransferase